MTHWNVWGDLQHALHVLGHRAALEVDRTPLAPAGEVVWRAFIVCDWLRFEGTGSSVELAVNAAVKAWEFDTACREEAEDRFLP